MNNERYEDELTCECGTPLKPHEEDGLCTACLTPKGLLCPCGELKPLGAELCAECYHEENSAQAPRKVERSIKLLNEGGYK